ncbi:hypothetical protein ACUXNS_001890 [Brevibacterium pityocampae]
MLRLILAALCAVIGLAVTALAVSAVAVTGTDDVTETEPFTVADGTYAIVLDEQQVPYEGTTATITAESDTELFIGTASGVDTENYLTGVAHETITGVEFPGALSHRSVPGEPQPVTAAATRDWWLASDTGTTVSHRFDLDAEPQMIVIAPADPETTLDGTTVSLSMDVKGVFGVSLLGFGLAVLAFGLAAFLLLRWWNTRLRPPPKLPKRKGTGDGRGTGKGSGDRPAPARRPGRRPGRLGGTAVGASAMALVLSGCSQLPLPIAQPAEPELTPYERPALRPGDAGTFMTDYTEALDATLAGDQEELDGIQTGPLLGRTRAEVLIARAEEQTLSAVAFTEVVAGGPMFDEYPMWFIGFGDPGEGESVQAMLVTRESAAEDWKAAQSLFVPREAVPTLLAGGDGAVPLAPDAHQDVAAAAAAQLDGFLETGTLPESPVEFAYPTDTFSSFREYVDQFSEGDNAFEDVGVTCEPYTEVPLSTYALETEAGAVSFGEVQCTITLSVPGDFSIDMGTAVEAVMTSDGGGNTVQIDASLPYLLTSAGAENTVYGSDWFLLSAQTSED